jgi:hypothetical protein
MSQSTRLVTRELTGLALAVLALGAAATPAQAHAHQSIRYVSVKACNDKDGGQVPCGPWRLALHDGKQALLKDAQVWPRDRRGKVLKGLVAPISVSGDGESVTYFRKGDGRLVVRDLGGTVHVMPKIALPKGVGMEELGLSLSQDGGHLAVEYYDTKDKQPTRVFDVSDPGEPAEIPGTSAFEGFSGGGSAVLVSSQTDDNTSELAAYDVKGNELGRVVPPQVVSNNGPRALSSDGRTVAFMTGTAAKALLKLYDMGADQIAGSVRFKLPGDTFPNMIDWTGEHEVTVHISNDGTASGMRMTVLKIDTETGAVKVRDSYKVRGDTYTYAACGG